MAARLRVGAGATRLRHDLARLAGVLAYRRQELLIVGLLASSVLGGFVVELWHRRAPAVLDRIEAEPPRLAALTRISGPRARGEPRRSRDGPRAREARGPDRPGGPGRAAVAKAEHGLPPPPPAPSAEHPLDLNGATAVELSELPGIGSRLATRILARRAELGGRFASIDELASVPGLGARKADRLRGLVRVDSPPDGGPPPAWVETPGPPVGAADAALTPPAPPAEAADAPP